MTIEHAKSTMENEQRPEAGQQPDGGILIPLQRRAAERRMSSIEREMVDGYVDFCEATTGINPRIARPEQSEMMAGATHAFLSQAVARRLERLKAAEGDEASPTIFAIPSGPVNRHIRSYYHQFGYTRRSKSPELQQKEEAYLQRAKRPIFVVSYGGGHTDSEGSETPIKEEYPRIVSFPELGLALRLHDLLTKLGHRTAADSTEVVVAAYGAWFPERIRAAASRGMILRAQEGYDAHNIKHWREDEIPEDVRAEQPRGQRTRKPARDTDDTLY